MITDLTALAAVLLANFRTVRVPAPDDIRRPPDDWWGSAKARRAEKRAAYACRDRLRHALIDNGHPLLDCVEADPDGGWRLHVSAPMKLLWRIWTRSSRCMRPR